MRPNIEKTTTKSDSVSTKINKNIITSGTIYSNKTNFLKIPTNISDIKGSNLNKENKKIKQTKVIEILLLTFLLTIKNINWNIIIVIDNDKTMMQTILLRNMNFNINNYSNIIDKFIDVFLNFFIFKKNGKKTKFNIDITRKNLKKSKEVVEVIINLLTVMKFFQQTNIIILICVGNSLNNDNSDNNTG